MSFTTLFAAYPDDAHWKWDRTIKIILFNGFVTLGLITTRQRLDALIWVIVLSLGFFALMAWTGIGMVRQQVMMNETIATLGWPSWVIGSVIPVSALVAIVCTLASLRDSRHMIAADEEGVS